MRNGGSFLTERTVSAGVGVRAEEKDDADFPWAPTHPLFRCLKSSFREENSTEHIRHVRLTAVWAYCLASNLAALIHVLLLSCAALASRDRKVLPQPSLQCPESKLRVESRTKYASSALAWERAGEEGWEA